MSRNFCGILKLSEDIAKQSFVLVDKRDGKYILLGDNADDIDVVVQDNIIGKMICKVDGSEKVVEGEKHIFSLECQGFIVDLIIENGFVLCIQYKEK